MRVVVRRTGLKPDLLRAWERRYGAIRPGRTGTNRRLYSDADVQRLQLLGRVTSLGHSINLVARLGNDEIAHLIGTDGAEAPAAIRGGIVAAEHVESCFDSIIGFDTERLRTQLSALAVGLGRDRFLEVVLEPLLRRVGDEWEAGNLRPVQEHLASAVIRDQLAQLLVTSLNAGPRLVLGTFPGHYHELGAMMAGVVAASAGWSVAYLGPNLPAEEIALAAQNKHAGAVAISLAHPDADPRVAESIRLLRRYLPQNVALLIGGRAASSYRSMVEADNTEIGMSLSDLRRVLARLQQADA